MSGSQRITFKSQFSSNWESKSRLRLGSCLYPLSNATGLATIIFNKNSFTGKFTLQGMAWEVQNPRGVRHGHRGWGNSPDPLVAARMETHCDLNLPLPLGQPH